MSAERTYFLLYGLFNFSWAFIAPMYVLFLLGRGLDLFQASMVPAVFFIVSVVLEVPTGAFADVVGRKIAFLLSCTLRMIAFAMYAVSHTFEEFVAAELVDAVGATLANGALDAWAVDGRHADGETQPADRFFARAHVIGRSAITVSGLAGGYLAQRDPALPWLCAAASFAVTGIVAAVLMREERRALRTRASRQSVLTVIRDGMIAARDLPVVRVVCLLTLAVAFAILPAQHLSWPRLQTLSGAGVWLMGWIWVLVNLASLAGSAAVPRLMAHRSRAVVLSVVTASRGVGIAFAASAATFVPALLGLLVMDAGFGVTEPVSQAWMNEHIPPERRATVLSVRSMCLTLGQGTGLLCLGRVARDTSIPVAWLMSAIILVAVAPIFLLLARRAEATAQRLDGGLELGGSSPMPPG